MTVPSVSEACYDYAVVGKVRVEDLAELDLKLTKAIRYQRVRPLPRLVPLADQRGGRQARWRVVPFQFRQFASALLLPPARVAASLSRSSPTCPF